MSFRALCFLCCMLLVSSQNLQTRNDDASFQSLMTLVQQQASTIQSLQSRVDALENTAQSLHNTVVAQAKELNSTNERVRKQVAFSAHMSATRVAVGTNSPFIFDAVVTNIGNSYNPHTGIFLAPHDGLYVFYFIMINDNNAATIHAAIEKDGTVLGVGTSDGIGANNAWDDGSVLVTTHLTKGDQVYVKRFDAGSSVWGNWYTNFSGFLLSADS